MKNPLWHFLLLCLILASCKSPIVIKPVKQSDAVEGIVRYALPANKMVVYAKIQKKTYKAGPYSLGGYTDPDLPAIRQELHESYSYDSVFLKRPDLKTVYSLKSISFKDTAMVDTKALYEVSLKKKKKSKKASLTIATDERSIIKSFKTEQSDLVLEYLPTVLTTAANIGTFFMNGTSSKAAEMAIDTNLTPSPLAKRAAAMALQLKKTSANINKSLSGSAYKFQGKEHLESSVKLMRAEEKKLLALFTRAEMVKEFTVVLLIDFPTGTTSIQPTDLFYLDKNNGFQLANNPNVQLLSPDPSKLRSGALPTSKVTYKYAYRPIAEQVQSPSATPASPSNSHEGFRYRIPLQINFSFYKGNVVEGQKSQAVSQLGTTIAIPQKLNSADMALYEKLGLISTITISKDPLNKEALDAGGTALKSLLDLRETELEELKKKAELLELKKKIEDLESNSDL